MVYIYIVYIARKQGRENKTFRMQIARTSCVNRTRRTSRRVFNQSVIQTT